MFIHTYETPPNWDNWKIVWHVAAWNGSWNVNDIRKWCYEIFGPAGFNHLTHDIRWKDQIRYGEIHFRKKEDLEWFLLRWS